MTDLRIMQEIKSLIKALKDHNGWWENEGRGGWFNYSILEDALTVIQRQRDKIERLENFFTDVRLRQQEATTRMLSDRVLDLTEQSKTARADAVREFAERLEAFVREKFDIADGIWIECDDDDEVANAFYFSRTELLNDVSDKIKSIVQEMTEGEQ